MAAPQTVRGDFVPAADYSEEFHRLEMERVWPRTWQAACREEEIPEPGDFVNYEIGNESILVVRDRSGAINAFYNVCPHRGRHLCDEERGTVDLFFCRYHAFTFDLDGKVDNIPSREDWNGCPSISDEDFSLTGVQCDTWAGWVWINMDPAAPSLREYLGPIADRLDPYEWELCRIRSHQTIIMPVTRAAAVDLAPRGIRVNALLPGLIKTEGTSQTPPDIFAVVGSRAPSGRVGEPDDIAGPATFLASPSASYINGHCLVVDGGMTIVG